MGWMALAIAIVWASYMAGAAEVKKEAPLPFFHTDWEDRRLCFDDSFGKTFCKPPGDQGDVHIICDPKLNRLTGELHCVFQGKWEEKIRE